MTTRPRMFIIILFVAAGLSIGGCAHKSESPDIPEDTKSAELPTVETAQVGISTFKSQFSLPGILATLPGHSAKIVPPFAGRLAQILVTPNQHVDAGQVIAILSTDAIQAQIAQAQATIQQNKVQVEQAKINAQTQSLATTSAIAQAKAQTAGAFATLQNAASSYRRSKRLYADGLIAQKDVDDALTAQQAAQATYDAQNAALTATENARLGDLAKKEDIAIAEQQVGEANAALRILTPQLRSATIRSPISGVVTTTSAIAGEMVDPSAPFITITDTSHLQVIAQARPEIINQIHSGQNCVLNEEGASGLQFAGKVKVVGDHVDTSTGAIPVTIDILTSQTNHLLKADMSMQCNIDTGIHKGFVIPKNALVTDPDSGQTSVYLVNSDGTVHVQNVKIGQASHDMQEIVSGISEGQSVAISGQYGLPDGAKVKPIKGM